MIRQSNAQRTTLRRSRAMLHATCYMFRDVMDVMYVRGR